MRVTTSPIVNIVDGVASIKPYLCAICLVIISVPVGAPKRLLTVLPGNAIKMSTTGIPTKGTRANKIGHPDHTTNSSTYK